MASNVILTRDNIVTFFRLPSSELDNLEKVKGQLIFTYDNAGLYFDVPNWQKQTPADSDIVRIHCDGVKYTLSREGQYLILTSADDPSVYQRVKLPSYTFTPDSNDKHLITIHCDDGTEDIVLDTSYTASDGVTLTGYNFTNSGIRDIDTGDQNGTIKINKNGTISNVPVYGLGTAAYGNRGVPNGIAELNANGIVPSEQLPGYVDDVIEGYYYNNKFYEEDTHTTEITGETGKIYVSLDTNKTYRWSGSTFVVISETLALGETDSTAYRGDRGAAAYLHAVTNKGIAANSGLYKITTNEEGHVTAVTAVTKSDITDLGIPAQDTTYTAGTGIDITNGVISNTQTSAEWGNITGDITDQTDLMALISSAGFVVNKVTADSYDLDNAVNTGFYFLSSTNITTLTNMPNNCTDGWLMVLKTENDTTIKQVFYKYGANKDWETYTRTYITSSSSWTDWTQYLTNKDPLLQVNPVDTSNLNIWIETF